MSNGHVDRKSALAAALREIATLKVGLERELHFNLYAPIKCMLDEYCLDEYVMYILL